MKLNKNDIQIISLLVAAIGIITSIFGVINNRFSINSIEDSELLIIATAMIALLTLQTSLLTVFHRIKPKKYIYISYSHANADIAETIIAEMNEQFKKTSKYRFELFTADSVSYGYNMEKTIESYIEQSDIIIVIVSQNYINSTWCKKEFMNCMGKGKTIIPVVTDSFENLSKLPVNLSDIKALSLIDVETNNDIKKQLSKLVVDLIKQRKY